MSADNWTQCPRCVHRKAAGVASREAEITAAYGKVTVEVFDEMRADFEAYRAAPVPNTWREDWEIGLYGDGSPEFYVSYRGGCSECGLSHEFTRSDPVWDASQEPAPSDGAKV